LYLGFVPRKEDFEMKKLMAILVVTVFAFAFVACKKDNANTTPDPAPVDDMAAPVDAPADPPPADAPGEEPAE
jgi:hypothetical protein